MGTTRQANPGPRPHPRGGGQGVDQRNPRRPLRWARSAAIALVAAITLGGLTAPSCAAAMVRLPDPPAPWSWPLSDVSRVVTTLAENYPNAPLTQRRRLHNDELLEVNAPWSAI